jgi:hypothetical protein
MTEITFNDCKADESGKVYRDWEDGEFRCMIMRGPCSLCGYIGVRKGNPIYGLDYDDVDIDCHGGLTFAKEGDGEKWPTGYWWYGWDYAHYGDAAFYEDAIGYDEIAWTVNDVMAEFPAVIEQFRNLSR